MRLREPEKELGSGRFRYQPTSTIERIHDNLVKNIEISQYELADFKKYSQKIKRRTNPFKKDNGERSRTNPNVSELAYIKLPDLSTKTHF